MVLHDRRCRHGFEFTAESRGGGLWRFASGYESSIRGSGFHRVNDLDFTVIPQQHDDFQETACRIQPDPQFTLRVLVVQWSACQLLVGEPGRHRPGWASSTLLQLLHVIARFGLIRPRLNLSIRDLASLNHPCTHDNSVLRTPHGVESGGAPGKGRSGLRGVVHGGGDVGRRFVGCHVVGLLRQGVDAGHLLLGRREANDVFEWVADR